MVLSVDLSDSSWFADPMTEPTRTKPLHPARRSLIIAVVIWVLVIRTVILIAADALGIPDVWSTVGSVALFLAIFIPLALAAVKELNDLRKRGDEPLPQIPTRRSLIAFSIFTILFWGFAIWFVLSSGDFVFPLLPIICTISLVVNIRRYYRAGQPLDADASSRPE